VAPIYAGTLGLLALVTSLAHGMIQSADPQAVLLRAWLSLLVFAALGYVVGAIAARAVEESVRADIQAELDASAGKPD